MFQDNSQAQAEGNRGAARALFGVAALLESQGANPYRVRAYRRAAVGMLRLPEGAGRYLSGGGDLVLPWLGERLQRKLGQLVRQGRMEFQEELLAALPRAAAGAARGARDRPQNGGPADGRGGGLRADRPHPGGG